MTSQRYSFARGTSGALGVFGLSVFLFVSSAHAQSAPAGAAAPAAGTAAPAAGTAAPAAAVPAAGAAPAEAGAASPAGAADSGDSGAYTVRLRTLEKNVNELKEQIFRTKARLNLLK
jgi:hypothetical protein